MKARIEAIDALIDAMILRIGEATADPAQTNFVDYMMDDGQMRIRTTYRGVADIEDGIKSLQKQKQYYVNQYNGRQTVLRDVRGLR